ncbi:unnamed protein product [Cuscuta campestris]|uniref:Uncharacterized protein n=1 Tax=Cuscuta campestris TaxID=132261 RepID=A0A484MPF8_9ASTE|nr:unnamed protein product [Cuscuta campestris]
MENSGAGVSKPTMPGGEIDLGQMERGVGRRLRDRVKSRYWIDESRLPSICPLQRNHKSQIQQCNYYHE